MSLDFLNEPLVLSYFGLLDVPLTASQSSLETPDPRRLFRILHVYREPEVLTVLSFSLPFSPPNKWGVVSRPVYRL